MSQRSKGGPPSEEHAYLTAHRPDALAAAGLVTLPPPRLCRFGEPRQSSDNVTRAKAGKGRATVKIV
jgi:hypothetical protein